MYFTPWAMYERIAWIWFSCFCWASENFRSKPFAVVSASWMDLVLAARQPLSAPTWAKPTGITAPAAPPLALASGVEPSSLSEPQPARPSARTLTPIVINRMGFFRNTFRLLEIVLSGRPSRGSLVGAPWLGGAPAPVAVAAVTLALTIRGSQQGWTPQMVTF